MQEIYIGATKRRYNLKRNRVYTNRPESLIDGLKEKFPLIEQLFVPVKNVNAALEEMSKAGTPRNIAARQIEAA